MTSRFCHFSVYIKCFPFKYIFAISSCSICSILSIILCQNITWNIKIIWFIQYRGFLNHLICKDTLTFYYLETDIFICQGRLNSTKGYIDLILSLFLSMRTWRIRGERIYEMCFCKEWMLIFLSVRDTL